MVPLPNVILELLDERHAQVTAWRLGVEAGTAGHLVATNPYAQPTDLAFDWLEGHAFGRGTTIPKPTRPVGV